MSSLWLLALQEVSGWVNWGSPSHGMTLNGPVTGGLLPQFLCHLYHVYLVKWENFNLKKVACFGRITSFGFWNLSQFLSQLITSLRI